MGISIAASMQNSGHEVSWVTQGRSADTRERAAAHNLREAPDLAALCAEADALVSVCPPAAATAVADAALAQGFAGLYLDANAIAPQRAQRMAADMAAAGATFVDGSIIGGPAWQPRHHLDDSQRGGVRTGRRALRGRATGDAHSCWWAGPSLRAEDGLRQLDQGHDGVAGRGARHGPRRWACVTSWSSNGRAVAWRWSRRPRVARAM